MAKALYLQIYDLLHDEIKKKKKKLERKIPSELEFSKRYNVNRHTVRKALQKLKDEGVIHTIKGRGNFITNICVNYIMTDKSSFSSNVKKLGYKPKTIILSANRIKANKKLSNFFKITTKMDLIELKLLRFADDVPIYLTYSYFDAYKYSKLFDNLDFQPFSLYELIKNCYPNIEITKTNTSFEAIVPNEDVRKYLNLPLNVPILKSTTISRDQDLNPVEFGIGYMRGDTCKVDVDLV